MHAVAQLVKGVVAEYIEIAGIGENAVAAVGNIVVDDFGIQ